MATVFHHNYVRHFAAGVTEHRSIIGRASRVLSERDEPEPRRVALFRAELFSKGESSYFNTPPAFSRGTHYECCMFDEIYLLKTQMH